MQIGGYQTHPAADCFPMLSGEDYQQLKASIEEVGLLEPVVIDDDDLIVDGRNRAKACTELGRDFDVENIAEHTDEDPISFVIAKNLARRHMTPGERAVAADKMARLPRGVKKTDAPGGASQADASDLMRVSRRTTQRVAALREAGRDDLYDAVGEGRMTPAAAARRMKRDAAVAKIRAEPEPLPEGPFRVIMADPPWRYEKRAEDESSRGKADDQYPTMSIEEICEMDVEDMAHPEGCILLLWVTNAHLVTGEAHEVVEAWGFEAKTLITWDKVIMGTGDWVRGQTEHFILAVRGKAVVNLTNQTTIIREKARRGGDQHSRKPERFYEWANELCPGSKVELFAREKREGITPWGAESDQFNEDVDGDS
jgi:N6-adenosine-specific RNA methylase IME4